MSLYRKLLVPLALVLALGLAGPVRAQIQVDDVQLFAPADVTTYGNAPYASEGFFFIYDMLLWNVSAPEESAIGAPLTRVVFALSLPNDGSDPSGGGFRISSNSLSTGDFQNTYDGGSRAEFGYVEQDNGWKVSTYHLKGHDQEIVNGEVDIILRDPQGLLTGFIDVSGDVDTGGPDGIDDDLDGDGTFGRDGRDLGTPNANPPPTFIPPPDGILDPFPTDFDDAVTLPVNFPEFKAVMGTKTFGADFLRTFRTDETQFPGWVELGVGLRVLHFSDDFNIDARGGVLADTRSDTQAMNNLLGPEFAIRWFNKCLRWTYSVDFRFAPALNFQSVKQEGLIGEFVTPGTPNSPLGLQPRGFNESLHETEFSPIVELRLNADYQITRLVSLRAGYSALYLDGIARASSMMDYNLDGFGLIAGNNTEDVILHGLNVGLEVNY